MTATAIEEADVATCTVEDQVDDAARGKEEQKHRTGNLCRIIEPFPTDYALLYSYIIR